MKSLARSGGALCVLGGLLVGVYLLSLSRPGPVQAGPQPAPASAPLDAELVTPAPVHPDAGQNIDQLMEHLTTLRAKKAELDRQEKEAITLLREKLKQQRQKLEKLGIPEETPQPPAVGADESPGSLTPPVPRPSTGPFRVLPTSPIPQAHY
jgi:hypothetical protein